MAALQPPTCHFLRIPRELRDEIYTHYFAVDDGYHHHSDTDTLRYLNGTAIDLAILHTCKQVAAEAVEFALSGNTVTFKTRIAFVAGAEGKFGPSLLPMIYYLDGLLLRLGETTVEAAFRAFSVYGRTILIHIHIHVTRTGQQLTILRRYQGTGNTCFRTVPSEWHCCSTPVDVTNERTTTRSFAKSCSVKTD